MEIGIRELRDGLSRHLAEVRRGRTVVVTDHGHAIARIVPVDQPTALERLIAEGRVRPATRRKRPAPEPVVAGGDQKLLKACVELGMATADTNAE